MCGARRNRHLGNPFGRGAGCWVALAALACFAGPSAAEDAGATDGQLAGGPVLITLALAYEHGEGVRKDLPMAAALYCQAARDGSSEAQFSLGWMYAIGRGVERDDAVAGSFFDLAAAAGHAHAQRVLAFVSGDRASLPDCMRPPALVAATTEPLPAEPVSAAVVTPDPFATLPPSKLKIVKLVGKLAPAYTIDPRLALAIIAVESNFEAAARSAKDARGLMQLIPETAARFNVKDPHDVNDNVRGGLSYLRWLLAHYQGQVPLAAAAYNAGEGAVDRYRGIPPYPETRDYVRRVLRLFGNEQHPYDARIVAPAAFLALEDDDPS